MKETFCEVCKSVHPSACRVETFCYWKTPQVFELVSRAYQPPPPAPPPPRRLRRLVKPRA